jgi:2,3-diketo-5-methylthiopentyl-1-phosphate enolase
LIKAKLPRLAGLDMGIILSPYGKFPVLGDKFRQCCMAYLSPLNNIKRSWPMPGGGTHPGHTEELMEQLGNDIIIAAGGAIHGHPMGPTAGSKAFRQAIDAVMSGQKLGEVKGQYKELDTALDKWGIFGDQKKIFALKG